jgi:hypothetical protein
MGPTAYFPSEGRRAADFITRKIHRPLPSLNPRTSGKHANHYTTEGDNKWAYRGRKTVIG